MSKEEFKNLYEDLLSQEWKEKQVWEYIKEEEMSVAPHFVGKYYNDVSIKFMIVGRCLNGWEVKFPNCETINDTLDSILNQPSRFEDAINEKGIPYKDENGKDKVYYYSKSAFWRLIKKLSIAYNNYENWNEKFVWSNLYKVSPRKGGNPSWSFVRDKIPTYIEIIKKEIEICKPTHIVFITDTNFLNPYNKPELCFGKALNIEEMKNDNFKYVVAKGKYNGAKIAVCKRPERRPTDKIVEEIKKIFEE